MRLVLINILYFSNENTKRGNKKDTLLIYYYKPINFIKMKNIIKSISIAILTISSFSLVQAQEASAERKGWDGTVKGGSKIEAQKSINNINGGMPNRISMNVTVAKQTQGATFGEKINSGKINVTLVEGGCIVLFPSNEGYSINTANKTSTKLSPAETKTFGEKVNQGLHAAGSALSQGASLLGGALPGGAIISAAVSSVGNLAGGAGGGAAAASYARTGKTVLKIQDNQSDAISELSDGEYELVFVIVEKATSGLKDTLKTQVRIGFSIENGILKTKHDTAKNSVSNIR